MPGPHTEIDFENAVEEIARYHRDTEFAEKLPNMTSRELLDTLFSLPIHEEKWTAEERWRLYAVRGEMYNRVG